MNAEPEPPEPSRPGAGAEPGHWARLDARQRALHEELRGFLPELGGIYVGFFAALAATDNPDHLAHAAHSARELMEKLAFQVNDPEPKELRGRGLGQVVDELGECLDALRQTHGDGPLEGQITASVQALVAKVEYVIDWNDKKVLTRSRQAEVVTGFIGGALPEPLAKTETRRWRDLHDFFQKVAHHRADPSTRAVSDHFAEVEEFLFRRWLPQTTEDLSAIDELLGKPDAD
jgi:hypothetical protein